MHEPFFAGWTEWAHSKGNVRGNNRVNDLLIRKITGRVVLTALHQFRLYYYLSVTARNMHGKHSPYLTL